jgi:hypothetical protein
MAKISFKPKPISKKLILVLPDRSRDIIIRRYGLGNGINNRMTLESIGEMYEITRERVRQIENHSLNTIRKSDVFQKEQPAFEELKNIVNELGNVVSEDQLLESITKDEIIQNHIVFLLVLGHEFKKKKEDNDLKHRWYLDDKLHDAIHTALKNLYDGLSDEDLIPESEMVNQFLSHLKDVSDHYLSEEIATRWLRMSKHIDRNALGEWGRAHSPNIKAKGIRDYAFLVLRRNGSPMHFTEVARKIEELFGKKAHTATTHNELIKDGRFVLVGRGLYALKEWGYISGIVKDVICEVLQKHGPLTREEIIEKVLKERYVKSNTVLVNLQDSSLFKKDQDGRFYLNLTDL